MQSILNKLFIGNAHQASKEMLDIYQKQGYVVTDYLYFANISAKKLFQKYTTKSSKDVFATAQLADYKQMDNKDINAWYKTAILDADVVLADGIALQIFYYLAKKTWLANLNGTDFAPYFLEFLKERVGTDGFQIILYGTYPHLIQRTQKYLENKGYSIVYAQDGYSDFEWNKIEEVLDKHPRKINVLLVARSTPMYPIQELWIYANKEKIKKHRFLVMNQGGTFDRWVGVQKRPPKLIRKIRMERLWRFIADPKRNYKKIISSLYLFVYIFTHLLLKKR